MLITSFEAEAVWYEPDFQDNRELHEDDRMAVLLEPLTKREVQQAEESASSLRAGKKSKTINFARRHNEMRDRVMRLRLREVVGLSVSVRGAHGQTVGTVPIETAEDLIAKASSELLDDIWEAMRDGSHLAEGVRGKSASASDSNSPQDPAFGTGAALGAEVTSSKTKTTRGTLEVASETTPTSTSTFPLSYSDAPGVS